MDKKLLSEYMKQLGSRGGKARAKKSAEELTRIGQQGAEARWKNKPAK